MGYKDTILCLTFVGIACCFGKNVQLICPINYQLSNWIVYELLDTGKTGTCIFCKQEGCDAFLQYCSFPLKKARTVTRVGKIKQNSGFTGMEIQNEEISNTKATQQNRSAFECPMGTSNTGILTSFVFSTIIREKKSFNATCMECDAKSFNISLCKTDLLAQKKATFIVDSDKKPKDELCLQDSKISNSDCKAHDLNLTNCVTKTSSLSFIIISVIIWILIIPVFALVICQSFILANLDKEAQKTNWLLSKNG